MNLTERYRGPGCPRSSVDSAVVPATFGAETALRRLALVVDSWPISPSLVAVVWQILAGSGSPSRDCL